MIPKDEAPGPTRMPWQYTGDGVDVPWDNVASDWEAYRIEIYEHAPEEGPTARIRLDHNPCNSACTDAKGLNKDTNDAMSRSTKTNISRTQYVQWMQLLCTPRTLKGRDGRISSYDSEEYLRILEKLHGAKAPLGTIKFLTLQTSYEALSDPETAARDWERSQNQAICNERLDEDPSPVDDLITEQGPPLASKDGYRLFCLTASLRYSSDPNDVTPGVPLAFYGPLEFDDRVICTDPDWMRQRKEKASDPSFTVPDYEPLVDSAEFISEKARQWLILNGIQLLSDATPAPKRAKTGGRKELDAAERDMRCQYVEGWKAARDSKIPAEVYYKDFFEVHVFGETEQKEHKNYVKWYREHFQTPHERT